MSTAVDIKKESETKSSALRGFAPLGSPENDIDDEDITDEQIRAMIDDHILLYAWVTLANQDDDECGRIRDKLEKDPSQIFEVINLRHCTQRYHTLCYKDRLWVPDSLELQSDIIQESHDSPACGHQGRDRTLELVKQQSYWPGIRETVACHVRNCHTCQRSKAPRDRYNGLLQALAVPEQCWQDISMDFITALPMSDGYNAINRIVDRLTKERHYAPCTSSDKGTSVERIVKVLMQYVFRTHGLPSSITSDRGPQFVSLVWKKLCERL